VVTMLGMDIAVSLSATLFVETAYGLPGLGQVMVTSLARRDFPVLLGITIYTTLVVIVVNFLIELVYGLVDPRARAVREEHERVATQRRAGPVPELEPAR
jgi:peptide/nickel transport system permease protein